MVTGKVEIVQTISFRWKYILLPLAILFLSIILASYFYRLLPSEVAYHFTDGAVERWMNRGALISWMLIPQFILVLLAVGIVWGAIKLSVRFPPSAGTRVERILCLMGNMIALPQIILGFAMLDIFSYNSYQMRIMPWWLFAAIIMGLGGIVLGIFFVLAIREILGTTRQEGFKELSDGGTSIQ